MDKFRVNLRIVQGCFKTSKKYNVNRESFQFEDGRRRKWMTLAVSVALVFLVCCLVLLLVYVFISNDNGEDPRSDIEILRQHRKKTERQADLWVQYVYELRKDADSKNAITTFNDISRRGYILQEIVKKFAELKNANISELQRIPEHRAQFRDVVKDLCQPEVKCDTSTHASPYRTIDGSCNNLYNPEWGMVDRQQRRSLPADYSDEFGSPRMYSKNGRQLPSPRLISNVIHSPNGVKRTDGQTTVMVMAFGQFLSHDIVATPMMDGHHSSVLRCCDDASSKPLSGPFKACFPVQLPSKDGYFKDRYSCMTFTRSAPAICDKCKICGREQINEMTSYIDASHVYGTTETATQLRTYSGGLLKTNTKGLLPRKAGGHCRLTKDNQYCFNAGDGRVNVVPNLSTMHTVFVRLHNQMAHALSTVNPHWLDELVYQETRKLLIAITQNIVYGEYLPVVLGSEYMQRYNLSTVTGFHAVYDSRVDATTSNGFNTAAFRFGHMTVPDQQVSLNDKYSQNCINRIEHTYHNPNMTFLYCDGLARWMAHGKGLQSDGSFSDGVRNLLFLNEKNVSFDLVALNIQRGRDHGLPSYNQYRISCDLDPITEEEFGRHGTAIANFSAQNAERFRAAYSHPDDIDVFSGGVKETPVTGAQVGPTFACMIAREFQRLKVGDRFYFENPRSVTGFTLDQLQSLKELSFAKVLCETMNISEIQPDIFRPVTELNKMRSCGDLSNIDFTLWKREA